MGQGYSTIAWIPEEKGSWVLPLRHERISSFDNPLTMGAHQLRQVVRQLNVRPISLWDSEYGNASFLQKTADIEADQLIRLRPNRCLWGAPPPYSGRGRPRKHGAKFRLNDSHSWSQPTQELEIADEQWGRIQIQHWSQLQERSCSQHPFDVLRISRLGDDPGQVSKPLWLCWVGLEMPTLETLFHLYVRRFALEHWYRFLKQRLHWCLPKLGTPQQAERWSDLMPRNDLATMVSSPHCWRSPSSLAEISLIFSSVSWTSCSVYRWYFSGNWNSSTSPQTPGKFSGLEKRDSSHEKKAISDGEKGARSFPIPEKIDSFFGLKQDFLHFLTLNNLLGYFVVSLNSSRKIAARKVNS